MKTGKDQKDAGEMHYGKYAKAHTPEMQKRQRAVIIAYYAEKRKNKKKK